MADRQVKRLLLKPLASRKDRTLGADTYSIALARLDEHAIGEHTVRRLRDELAPKNSNDGKADWKDQKRARELIELAKALYASRRISTQQYVFYAVNPAEDIHSSRWFDGAYDTELGPINAALDAIRDQRGLGLDEDWRRGEGPDEYIRLQMQYEAILNKKFVEILEEFGLKDLANLQQENAKHFDQLRERGRRTVFHSNEFALAVRDVVLRYEIEARQAANAKAYSAAIICLGAGIEGLLLLRCLRSKKKAAQIAGSLPRRIRPPSLDDASKWTFETLVEVCLTAGWLPQIETSIAQYDAANLAHALRLMRNYVHPGRRARERPWSEVDERDYQDANAIYIVLFSILGKISRTKKR